MPPSWHRTCHSGGYCSKWSYALKWLSRTTMMMTITMLMSTTSPRVQPVLVITCVLPATSCTSPTFHVGVDVPLPSETLHWSSRHRISQVSALAQDAAAVQIITRISVKLNSNNKENCPLLYTSNTSAHLTVICVQWQMTMLSRQRSP